MTNDRITNSENYKDIVKHALDNKPISLGGAKKKTEQAKMPQILQAEKH